MYLGVSCNRTCFSNFSLPREVKLGYANVLCMLVSVSRNRSLKKFQQETKRIGKITEMFQQQEVVVLLTSLTPLKGRILIMFQSLSLY